jgi:hypothetical protein
MVTLYRPADAEAGANITIGEGESKTLDGSASIGTISTWTWDIFKGGVWVPFGTGETLGITFAGLGLPEGDYLVQLTTNSAFTSDTDTMTLHVDAVPEPATMALLALGGITALVRRRRTR